MLCLRDHEIADEDAMHLQRKEIANRYANWRGFSEDVIAGNKSSRKMPITVS